MSWGMSGMCGEIAEPLDEQIAGLRVLGVPRANLTKLRLTADGPALSIDELSDEQLAELRRRLDGSGIGCYCVTSPVAKYAVDTDEAKVERQLARSIEAANVLRSRWIRVFSFAPRDGSTGAEDRDAVKAAFERLVRRIETDGDGAVALLENNYRMYTLDGESTRDILSDYEPEQAALAFDAHAYVASETRPFDEAWVQGGAVGAGAAPEGLRGGDGDDRPDRPGRRAVAADHAGGGSRRGRGPGAGAAPE